MTTIHYALEAQTGNPKPDDNESRAECDQFMRQAAAAADIVCSSVGVDTASDLIITADRYLIDIHLGGDCVGCEPLTFGWTRDFGQPHNWVMRGFCKTSTAKNPLKTHILAAHVIEAWRRIGLVDWTRDEAGYLPELMLDALSDRVQDVEQANEQSAWAASLKQAVESISDAG